MSSIVNGVSRVQAEVTPHQKLVKPIAIFAQLDNRRSIVKDLHSLPNFKHISKDWRCASKVGFVNVEINVIGGSQDEI